MFRRCSLFFLAAITPLHVGVGRSPGVVDLPVVRDNFGVPFLPASSIRGPLKSLCLRGCYRDSDSARCRKCLGAFGWDIRFEEAGVEEAYASPIVFTDGFLLFYPVRVEDENNSRLGYATSVLQLRRVADIVEACSEAHGDTDPFTAVLGRLLEASDSSGGDGGRVFINNIPVNTSAFIEASGDDVSWIFSDNRFPRLVNYLSGRVYVFRDSEVFREIVEAGLVRQTRVRLDPERKTVERGALWTEEYVSQGAVFVSAAFIREVNHPNALQPGEAHCFLRHLLRDSRHTLFMGGKESIGKGLVRVVECCPYSPP